MGICSQCGDFIEFRYINGSCTPMHASGRCKGTLPVNDYYSYQSIKDSCCFNTTCPECGDGVCFIKHNGGSVWIREMLIQNAKWQSQS
jgi:ribosomal protein S27AE